MTNEQFHRAFQQHLQVGEPRRSDIIAEVKTHIQEAPMNDLGDPKSLAQEHNRVHLGVLGSGRWLFLVPWLAALILLMFGNTYYDDRAFGGTVFQNILTNLAFAIFIISPLWLGAMISRQVQSSRKNIILSASFPVAMALLFPLLTHISPDPYRTSVQGWDRFGLVGFPIVGFVLSWVGYWIGASTHWHARRKLGKVIRMIEVIVLWAIVWLVTGSIWAGLYGLLYMIPEFNNWQYVHFLITPNGVLFISGIIVVAIAYPFVRASFRSIRQGK